MKHIQQLLTLGILCLFVSCSEDFLDLNPKGIASENLLTTPENAEKMVIIVEYVS